VAINAREKSRHDGAQIDLITERFDNAITICEIKYTEQPFVIDKLYAPKLLQIIKLFKKRLKGNNRCFIVHICAWAEKYKV
jgi:hypothetical protein